MCLFYDTVVSGDFWSIIRGLMEHLVDITDIEGVSSGEFRITTTRRNLNASFWEGKELVTKVIANCGRDVSVVKSFVALTTRLVRVTFMDATIISCAGCGSDLIIAVVKSLKAGVQYQFNLSHVQVEMLMLNPSFIDRERIDMFCLLRTLLVILSGLLDELWVNSAQFLKKVDTCGVV